MAAKLQISKHNTKGNPKTLNVGDDKMSREPIYTICKHRQKIEMTRRHVW